MGIFSQKPKFKVAPPVIRKVAVPYETAKPKPKSHLRDSRSSAPPAISRGANQSTLANDSIRSSKTHSASPRQSTSPSHRLNQSHYLVSDRPSSHSRNGDRKRKLITGATHRTSPVRDRIEFDKDSDADDDDWEMTLSERKRKRLNGSHVDLNRLLAHSVLLETLPCGGDEAIKIKGTPTKYDSVMSERKDAKKLKIIHARDVASLALNCVPVLGAAEDEVAVNLQYPGSRHRESYELVWGKDKIDAVKDIKTTIKHIAQVYLTEEQASPFLDSVSGFVRQLERASSETVGNVKMFKLTLDAFNSRLLEMHNDGTLALNISERHDLPRDLVAFILDQVYDRTVAPNIELLKKYENGSDNVYGELLHPFVTDILVDRLKMTSGQVFVDLGSGVGNVVLQAALEIGCESWGCEMMDNACNLADAQKKEFMERCRLWGIAPGSVHIERGDFRQNTAIQDALKRADVVLVNNQAFTSQLNDDLVRMFLDFKSGCKIVSLKSFVHDHKSASHNINDVGSSILDVEMLTYPEGFVSWTGAAGSFCISTKR